VLAGRVSGPAVHVEDQRLRAGSLDDHVVDGGELEGVGRFKMSRAHLNGLVKRERRRRLVASGIESRAGGLAGDVLDAAEAEMARLKRKQELTEKDHAQLRRLALIARDLSTKPQTVRAQQTSNGGASFLETLEVDEPPRPPVATGDPGPARTPTPAPKPPPTAPVPDAEPMPAPTIAEVLADLDQKQRQLAAEQRAAPTTLAQEAQAARARHATEKQIITGARSSTVLRALRKPR
jgi:outer membrane biosynthesis protein TonB